MLKASVVDKFYHLLGVIESKTGGKCKFKDISHKTDWPSHGIFFLYEPGEFRSKNSATSRITYVGTHAISANSKSTLIGRLKQIRGTYQPKYGNHRGAILRQYIGQALMNKNPNLKVDSWGHIKKPSQYQKTNELPLEKLVSEYISEMTILAIPIVDKPDKNSARAAIKKNVVALLSEFNNPLTKSFDSNWLGSFSNKETIRESGLWNHRFVDGKIDNDFLTNFEHFVTYETNFSKKVS